MRAVAVAGVPELAARAEGHDVVGIDEVQFFEPAIVATALALADRGVRVIPSGLDQDFRRLPFGVMPDLLATRSSSTSCKRSATAAAEPRRRRSDSSTAGRRRTRATPIVVGAAEQYEARCRDCHEAGISAVTRAA